MNKRHLIDVLAQLREQRRHHLSAFTAWAKLKRRLHQIANGILEKSGCIRKVWRELPNRLSMPLLKIRLIVPGIDLARTTIDEDPNDSFGCRRKMRWLWSERLERSRSKVTRMYCRTKQTLLVEQRSESEKPESATRFVKQLASMH
jgi:hypothetical protein